MPRLAPLVTEEVSRLLQLSLARHARAFNRRHRSLFLYQPLSAYVRVCRSVSRQSQSRTRIVFKYETTTFKEPTAIGKSIHDKAGKQRHDVEECGEKVEILSFQGLNAQAQAGSPASSNFMPKQEGAEGRKVPTHLRCSHSLSTRLASGGYFSCSDSWMLGRILKELLPADRGRPLHIMRSD